MTAGWASAAEDHERPRREASNAGFTLIELMIVVLVIAILSAIAYPSYTRYVTRTHRVAAQACLSEYANFMERAYTQRLSYLDADGDALQPELACSIDTARNYGYAVSAATQTMFTVRATARNAQAHRDATCSPLTLDQAGARTPAACWRR